MSTKLSKRSNFLKSHKLQITIFSVYVLFILLPENIIDCLITSYANKELIINIISLGVLILFSKEFIFLLKKLSHSFQVIIASTMSVTLLITIISYADTFLEIAKFKNTQPAGFWTFLTLVISSPVAFVIWRFRDENQSKDINLKEFQKIAEWVSGMHFPEDENKSSEPKIEAVPQNSDIAFLDQYGLKIKQLEKTQSFHSEYIFNKKSGAESLQITAIYNLLPFYRGDHGSSFEKPAVNLLKSTWAMMQQDLLQQLNELEQDKTKTPEEIAEQQDHICQELRNRANSPLGQAITRVWMACDHNGQLLIHRHPEIFAGLCLSGMNFGLAGLEIETLRKKLFTGRDKQGNSFDYSGIQLQAANLFLYENIGFNFSGSSLNKANFLRAELHHANFIKTNLWKTKFSNASLWCANFSKSMLSDADFSNARLFLASFSEAKLSNINFQNSNLEGTDLSNSSILITEEDFPLFTNVKTLENTLIRIHENSKFSNIEKEKFLNKKEIILIEKEKIDPIQLKTISCTHRHTSKKIKYGPSDINIDLPKTQALNPDWEIEINYRK